MARRLPGDWMTVTMLAILLVCAAILAGATIGVVIAL